MPRLRDKFTRLWQRQPALASPKSDIGTPLPKPPQSRRTPMASPEPDPTPTRPTSITPPVPSDIQDIRRQIWNEAYEKLKDDEADTVDAYERILSAELAPSEAVSSADRNTANIIREDPEARQGQMMILVEKGRDKTTKETKVKEKFKKGIQPVNNVKNFVSMAVKSEPSAAVAWLGITTLIDIFDNPLTEPGINRDGIKYILERVEWYWELAQLLLDPGKVDTSIVRLQGLLRRRVFELYGKLLLYQMQSVCLYNRHWAAVIARDLFKADDWQAKVDSIMKVEASLREDLGQHNSEELKSRLRSIDNSFGHLRLDVKAVESAVQDNTQVLREIHHDANDQKCLQDLCIIDPEAHKENIEKTKGGLLKDSYHWILEHEDFRRFREDAESRLLWIKGDPGKGKTMLLCGIIDHIKQQTSQVLSYYFCQATQVDLKSAASVLRGLLWLLCCRQPILTSFVRSVYDVQGRRLFEDGVAFESLGKIFLEMLKDPCLREAVFVVDALDECSDDTREALIDFILDASRRSSSKWIVSSRNWPSIEAQFQDSEKIRVPLELNKDSISQAVRTFIRYKVEQLARRKKYNLQTKDEVLGTLLHKANDTFLWAALVCKELARPQVKAQDTMAVLESVPVGLDEFYQRMLQQVLASRDRYRQILAAACITYRPVSLDELRCLVIEVKTFSDEQLEEVIAECGSFLTLQDGVVYFVHQSAQDFLTGKAEGDIFPSGIQDQHRLLFQRSLHALMTLRRDMYSLRYPGALVNEVSRPTPDPLSELRYSCLYWIDHLGMIKGHRKQSEDEAIDSFIRQRFLYWLEALSLQDNMSQGVKAVQKLKHIIADATMSGLVDLVEDALRFVLSHSYVIGIAPLQAYASALIFSPEHSRVRDIFKKEEPGWIVLKPKMEANWDACLQTLEGHGDWVQSVVFSADGQRLASGSIDKTIKIWDAISGACLQTLEGHNSLVQSVAFSANGQRLASGSIDKTIKIWDVNSGACLQTLEGHGDRVTSVVFSVDGQRLASGSDDRTIKNWDANLGACLQTLKGHSDRVTSAVFSADSQRLTSGSGDKTIKIWDASSGACLQTLEGHGDRVTSVVFSVDGQRLASGSDDGTIKIWDANLGACLQALEGHDSWVKSVVFSADGQRLASGSDNGTIKIWDAISGACLQTLEGHDGWVKSVVFSANGQRLASGSGDETIKIWDAISGACLQTLIGHSDWINSVVFSADGQRLASGSDDGTIKIWDANSGACLQTLEVGRWLTDLTFDSTANYRLFTDIGVLNLDIPTPPPGTDCQSEAVLGGAKLSAYVIDTDDVWIVKDGRRMLWLPANYRPLKSAVAGTTVAIGCRSGRVLLIKFS